jgi:GNAT superfamily N-acetyltransferase
MLEVRALRVEDVAGARRLSDQAGWNHLDADWLRLISLWPETCIAGWLDGKLVATATLAMFDGADAMREDHLAWVGVMLVDAEQRGKGFGGTMFDAVLKLGAERGVTNFGLDATDMGRPLYAKRGFKDLVVMHRWKCASPIVGPVDRELPRGVRPMEDWDWESVQSLDRQMSGVDRSRLIETIAAEAGVTVLVAEEEGTEGVTGFAVLRPGRVAAYIGPIVALDAATAAALFRGLMGRCATAGVPVFVDTVTQPVLEPALIEEGFAIARTLTRMGRTAAEGHRMAYGEGVFAIAGLELC